MTDLQRQLNVAHENLNHQLTELLAMQERIKQLEDALQTLTLKAYADFDSGRKLRRSDIDKAQAALGEKKDA